MRLLLATVLALLLTGCGTTQLAPVAERSQPRKAGKAPASYTVRKGDTLYSITWRYGLDFRKVARLNRLDGKYRIYPGQRLRLTGVAPAPARAKARTNTVKKPPRPAPAPVKTPPPRIAAKPVRPAPAVKVTPPVNAGNQSVVRVTKPVTAPAKAESLKPGSSASRKNSAIVGKVRWQWPADGKVIEGFKTRGRINKGINIAGRRGDPVYAAASGEVVYAGSGLLGYGNLIIVNHNGLYMSAYAHNSRIFVKERDRVTRGDRIAEIGSSGTDRHMLHFEIRRDGKPVNPAKYLPKR